MGRTGDKFLYCCRQIANLTGRVQAATGLSAREIDLL